MAVFEGSGVSASGPKPVSLRPYIVAVVGGTGSGKTTIAKRIYRRLPQGEAVILSHDSYYRPRPDIPLEERHHLNFDHPDSLESELLAEHLTELCAARGVDVPSYDFATHLRSETTTRVEPAPTIIVEGILLLNDPALRALFDLKIYVDTDADVRVLRRITRDLRDRGRTYEQVRDQYYETVRPMHEQFVEPTKRFADVIIPEGGHNQVALDLILARLSQGHRLRAE